MDRKNIEKISQNPEERLLLAKIWDKITAGIQRNIPAHTGFLSARELELARFLFGSVQGLHAFGGYEDAERKMLIYLPDYLDESALWAEDSAVVCVQASFYEALELTHRDFLGALMGMGIAREAIGDICITSGCCTFFATTEIAPYILQNMTSAGRAKLQLQTVSLENAQIEEPKFLQLHDTLASVRLDSVISAGFRISRSSAMQQICAGKASIDGQICDKPDKPVAEGAKISLRGSGKIQLASIGNQTKKGRISVVIHRYI